MLAQNRQAILVGGPYLSNPGEARAIAGLQYGQKLAQATAKGVLLKARFGGNPFANAMDQPH